MSNDAQGNPIVEGDKYLEAATAKQDEGGKVTLGDGARVALPGDLYPTSALGGGGGGGVTDHGALTGLGDDDHTQYHNDTRGDARYYTKSAVDSALAGKANSSHTHTLSDITDAGTAAAADTGDFAAASHTHTLSQVTDAGALAALDTVGTSEVDDDAITYAKVQNVTATDRILGRATAGAGIVEEIPCTAAGRAIIDGADAGAQRTTLGLGDSATRDVGTGSGDVAAGDHTHTGTYAPASHTHTLSEITDAGDSAGLDVGTSAGTVAAGDHTHVAAQITDLGDSATKDVGTAAGTVAAGDHGHTLAAISDAGDAAGLDVGTTAGTVAAGDHNHSSVYSPVGHTHTLSEITDAGALAALDTVGTSEIADDAVTYAKVQNVSATNKLLGRATAGAGVIEEIDCTPAGRALIDDADAASQRTTLGLGTAAVEPSSAFAAASHTHVASDVTDLGNSATRDVGTGSGDVAAGDHTHALNDLTDVTITTPSSGDQIRYNGSQWVNFTPLAPPVYLQQTNNLSDLLSASAARTNLGLGSAAVQDSGDVLQVANDLADINDPAAARTNLELGSAAEEDISAFAPASHTHTVSQITDYKAPGYLVWAEDNTGLALGYQWAFGANAGSSSAKGIVILKASTLTDLGLIASAGAGESGTVEVIKNGSSTGVSITITGAATSATATGLSLSFAAGDILNFETTAVTGSLPGQVTMTAWLALA